MSKLEKYFKFMPDALKPRVNPMLRTLLEAWAGSDAEIETQLQNTKAQLFVRTAEGTFLDKSAANLGVSRPAGLGMLDSDFQELIPNLSLKQKQIVKSFYDTMDVFWGPLFSRANITSSNTSTFTVAVGDSFTVTLNGLTTITYTTVIGDIAQDGAATATEMERFFNQFDGMTAEILVNETTGDERISLRTDTPGPRGSLEVDSANSMPGIGFVTDFRHRITDIEQRTVIYQVNPGELTIELPAIVPTLRRVLKGSHHFHTDATIEPAIAPSGGIWQGSFIYSTTQQPFAVTEKKAILSEIILKGSVINEITVDDSVDIPNSSGNLIINFGKENEEQPIEYITVPNDRTILIDPGHTFQFTHAAGSEINVLLEGQNTPYAPRKNGADLAIYLVSPVNIRTIIQELLETLTAAGITIRFIILLPEYIYLFDNPYEE